MKRWDICYSLSSRKICKTQGMSKKISYQKEMLVPESWGRIMNQTQTYIDVRGNVFAHVVRMYDSWDKLSYYEHNKKENKMKILFPYEFNEL